MDSQSLYTLGTEDDNVLRITKTIKVNVTLLPSYHSEADITLVFPASYDISLGTQRESFLVLDLSLVCTSVILQILVLIC